MRYEDELTDLLKALEEKKASQADEYTIKKMVIKFLYLSTMQGELIDEAKMMVSDCTNRLTRAVDDLSSMIKDCEDLSESEQYKAANNVALEQCAGDS